MCATVTAVNGNDSPVSTLYETNWVMYWAQALTAGTTVVISDVADARQRHGPQLLALKEKEMSMENAQVRHLQSMHHKYLSRTQRHEQVINRLRARTSRHSKNV